MKIAIAQINPTVGNLKGNLEQIVRNIHKAKEKKADLVIFPELSITGYPPKDLINRTEFLKDNKKALDKIIKETKGISAIVGFIDYHPKRKSRDGKEEKYNAAAFIQDGKLKGVQYKTLLPTYDVFDEHRYFTPATTHASFSLKGKKVRIQICEDLWDEHYKKKVTDILAKDADFIINISASPFEYGKREVRQQLLSDKAKKNKVPILYVNQVGGQDDLVFDGESMVVDKEGNLIAVGKKFEEDFFNVDLDEKTLVGKPVTLPKYSEIQEIHDALVLGVQDYFRKQNFPGALIGLSGGIDSAVTAAIAVEALGSKNVLGVSMPSRYSSDHSKKDAYSLAKKLGMKIEEVPIENMYKAFGEEFRNSSIGKLEGLTSENLQARIRGNTLMAYSNKFGYLVLATGNKSELAVGYCTLYGDMCGGFSVLSDVLKTKVYELARYINREKELIPQNTIDKEPSAELAPNQKDEDSLPPYSILDGILRAYIEENQDPSEIIKAGYNPDTVNWVVQRVDGTEFKRRQAAPGIKITEKAFGTGRHMPIVNHYQKKK